MNWLDYTEGQILDAELMSDPFPYLAVSPIFPEWYYKELLANRSKEAMEVLNPKRPRLILWMGRKTTPKFWNDFWVEAAGLVPALVRKFDLPAVYIDANHDAQLLHDDPGYELGPHTDIPEKLLTGLFYLPDDDSGCDYGTVLYRSDLMCKGSYDHDWGPEYEKVVTVPYVRNAALFFPCHDKSWHAVEPTPVERWVISMDILR